MISIALGLQSGLLLVRAIRQLGSPMKDDYQIGFCCSVQG
jgi:hypothetical protein